MRLHARTRGRLAGWLIAMLLFMQFATLAYACPQPPVAESPVEMAMSDCAEMTALDPEQPQLCKAHCQTGTQTVNNTATPGAEGLATPLLLWVFDRGRVSEPLTASPLRVASERPARPPGTPPVYLSFLVLRN